MKIVELSKGQLAIVDDEDYENIIAHGWSAHYDATIHGCYARRSYRDNGKKVYVMMHREIIGANKGEIVDHINRNTLDNRKCNLRKCTASQSAINRRKIKNTSSKYIGVLWNKNVNKWQAQIELNGKKKYLGLFLSEDDAAIAYNNAAKETHKDFAKINVVAA